MESLTIKYKLKAKDLFSAHFRTHLKILFSLKTLLITLVFLVWLALLLAALQSLNLQLYWGMIYQILILLALAELFAVLSIKSNAKKQFQYDKLYSKPIKRIITKEGITTFFGDSESMETWDNFLGYKILKNYYTLAVTWHSSIYLPKSAFETEQERIFFLECLKQIEDKAGNKNG